MAKIITSNHELIEWVESILLDEDFARVVSCPKVHFNFALNSFDIIGDLSVNFFSLGDVPSVLEKADKLDFFAEQDMLCFRARFEAD